MNKQNLNSKPQGKLKLNDFQRVWSLLPAAKKPKALALMVLMIFGMLLEMIGVGLIVPIIAVVTNPDFIEQYAIAGQFHDLLGNPSHNILVVWAMILLVVIYVFKNAYLAFLAWQQSRFVFETQADLAKDLFQHYLHQPYTFHLQKNSADLINNLQTELNLFINYMLNPGMLLIAEALVVIGLVSLLLYFEPVGALTVFAVFVIAGGIFQWSTRRRIIFWGKQRQQHEALRMKHAQQGIGAIKDVKIYGKEAFFSSAYARHTEQSLKMHQRNSFVQNLTRLWLEVLSIMGLAILFIGMIAQGKSVTQILPVLALFGAVSFRLMPSVSRMVASVNLLRFGTAITDIIESEFATVTESSAHSSSKKLDFKSQIKLKNISYSYPGSDTQAVKDVNIEILKGQMVGLVGVSGSGKSTLIDILMGLLKPQKGTMSLDGQVINGSNVRSWQRLMGYVPQFIYLTDDTLKNNIAFGLKEEEIDEKAIKMAISAAQLDKLVSELPEGLETMLGERGVRLSGGQRQRIGIARALYHDPEILILDEATSALDMDTESDFMNAVNRLHGEKTILIIAHRHSTLQNADQVFSMNQGRLTSTSLGSGN